MTVRDRLAALVSRGGQRIPLGWRQLRHDRGRLAVAVAGITFADVLMFTQLGFQAALYDANTQLNRAFAADLVLLSPKAQNLQNLSTFPRRRLLQATDVPGVAHGQGVYLQNLTWRNPQTRQNATVQVLGVDPDARVLNLPELNRQRDRLKLPDTVLFDRLARGAYAETIARLEQGQSVSTEAERRSLTIAGLFSLGASFGADATLVMGDQSLLRLFPMRDPGSLSLGLLRLQPGVDPQRVAAAIDRYLPEDVRVLTLAEYVRFEENYWRTASPIGVIFGLGTAMAFLVGVVIVFQVLTTDVNAHLGEYATFRAMGFRQRYLLLVVVEQALVLAALGFLPGATIQLGLYALAAQATALPIAMTAPRALLVFGLTLLMCLASGAIASRRLQAADPAELF
ncbi:ABC transporter permease DevC [Cyanobium sp. Copco_Reservoir_LC18]|jgi:putative ABC transport system permease protein|uniref:ABC transporter permease DevC n=1 Tax=Cyanobium sp. Copco_Reservoir_LC18 TaxID=1328305 RepID=UPI0013594B78|nr:ABC transporter permease DevC [Cyanobium sp. Copco_Reservoir_LC18]